MKRKDDAHDGTIGEHNPWPKRAEDLRRWQMGSTMLRMPDPPKWYETEFACCVVAIAILALLGLTAVMDLAAKQEESMIEHHEIQYTETGGWIVNGVDLR